jgi:hypothetical protein
MKNPSQENPFSNRNKGFSGGIHQHVFRIPKPFLENPIRFFTERGKGFLENQKGFLVNEKPFPRKPFNVFLELLQNLSGFSKNLYEF